MGGGKFDVNLQILAYKTPVYFQKQVFGFILAKICRLTYAEFVI